MKIVSGGIIDPRGNEPKIDTGVRGSILKNTFGHHKPQETAETLKVRVQARNLSERYPMRLLNTASHFIPRHKAQAKPTYPPPQTSAGPSPTSPRKRRAPLHL